MAVEEEIQNELKETVVSDEEYLECGNYCWQRFYSCCVQYHVAGLKPLGLLLLPNSSGAVLLKKSNDLLPPPPRHLRTLDVRERPHVQRPIHEVFPLN
jgi:nuclear pore complex protein Nup160